MVRGNPLNLLILEILVQTVEDGGLSNSLSELGFVTCLAEAIQTGIKRFKDASLSCSELRSIRIV